MKNVLLDVAALLFLVLCLLTGLLIIENAREYNKNHTYVLWCIDKEGIQQAVVFKGIDENDINPIKKCRDIMFEPTNYYIVPLIVK